MTGDLMLYGIAVALLFGLAGLALEQIAAWRGVARRGAWMAALILSVAMPTLKLLAPHRPALSPVVSFVQSIPWSEQNRIIATSTHRAEVESASPAVVESGWQRYLILPSQVSVERVLRPIWLAASLGMMTFYALLWLRLRVAARHWRREEISGQEVWVTEALGPAVYGIVRPVILMPQWVIDGPHAARAVVLAHEQEHIAAGDSRSLLLGLLLVAITPWNLPLWWQLRRLRFAIEVDCDARVLRRGAEAIVYGEVLLSIGQRRSLSPIGAITLTEPASQLLRRIRIMTAHMPKRSAWYIGTAAGLSLACIAIAADLQAPPLDSASAPTAISAGLLLKPPLVEDPRQAVIRKAVRSTYPELFSSSAAPGWVAITLLMSQEGTLIKGYKDETRPHPYITGKAKAFDAMGAESEHYGDRVQLDMRGGPAGATRIYVRAYLPLPVPDPTRDVVLLKAGEAAPKRWQPEYEGPAAPNDDPAVNRAIAEKYFPDLYTYATPINESIADFWVLLSHEGKVLATGRRYSGSRGDMKLYLESLYPGIRTDGFQPTEMRSDHRRPAVVNFMWLAADSPVSDLSKADLSRRSDVALYAVIGGDGSTAETTLIVLKFGSPSIAVCDNKDLNLQVIATNGGADTVVLRARIQHVARAQPAEFEFGRPNAVKTAWSPESPPVRVRFGESTELQVTDQDHNTWTVMLRPDRMQGAISIQ